MVLDEHGGYIGVYEDFAPSEEVTGTVEQGEYDRDVTAHSEKTETSNG